MTVGILALFVGISINRSVKWLRRATIPDPVTGGLLFAAVIALVYWTLGTQIRFTLGLRDILILYFFTTIGLNARFSDIRHSGKAIAVLLGVTVLYMALQNAVGVASAVAMGVPAGAGLLVSSISLVGGHGTAIAWAPILQERLGIGSALELGIASATFGLVIAALIGGPIARYLIRKHDLIPDRSSTMDRDSVLDVGIEDGRPDTRIHYRNVLDAILGVNISVLVGNGLYLLLEHIGFMLPLFVCCLLSAIVLTNLIPYATSKERPGKILAFRWPTQTSAVALVADLSLGMFLAMSLMDMKLWELADLAGPMVGILVAQTVFTVFYVVFVVFRTLGKDYNAAVLCAGFAGYGLGATPTAIVNMTAVTKRYGPAHLVFIVLPLVAALFIDIANSLVIRSFVAFLGE